jgi:hypothetical protein
LPSHLIFFFRHMSHACSLSAVSHRRPWESVPGQCAAAWGRSGRRCRRSHRARTWAPRASARGRIGRCQTGGAAGSSSAGRARRSHSGRGSWRRWWRVVAIVRVVWGLVPPQSGASRCFVAGDAVRACRRGRGLALGEMKRCRGWRGQGRWIIIVADWQAAESRRDTSGRGRKLVLGAALVHMAARRVQRRRCGGSRRTRVGRRNLEKQHQHQQRGADSAVVR